MSPTADDIEKTIGRRLQPRDVLISYHQSLYEVVGQGVFERTLARIFYGRECVDVKLKTDVGLGEETKRVGKGLNVWSNWILKENRTDQPSLKER